MQYWFARWGPGLILMAAIFFFSSIPGSELPVLGTWDVIAKKAAHMVGYALLAAAFLHAWNRDSIKRKSHLMAPFALAVLYAVTDEWHQSFVPGRNASAWDVVIDAAGSFMGLTVWVLAHRRIHRIR